MDTARNHQPSKQAVLINGKWGDGVSVFDRGFMFGDGLFETLLYVKGRFPLLSFHMDRLDLSSQAIGLPVDIENVRDYLDLFIREQNNVNNTSSCNQDKFIVKVIVTRGNGGQGYSPPQSQNSRPSIVIFKREYNTPTASTLILKNASVRLSVNPVLAGHKHLSCLEYVMAGRESVSTGEQVLLNSTEGHVIEALHHNIFWVANGELHTPMLDRCGVSGVMRKIILERVAPALSIPARIARANLDVLKKADEVFVCNSVRGIIPVSQVDEHYYSGGAVLPRLQRCLSGLYVGAYD